MDEDIIVRQEKKIDELTATVNRLSANFDAYAAQNPPAYVSNSFKYIENTFIIAFFSLRPQT